MTEKVKQVWDNPNVWKTINIILMLVIAMFAQAGYISRDAEQQILDSLDERIAEVVEGQVLQQTIGSTFYRLGDVQADIAVQKIGGNYYGINTTSKKIMFSAVDRDKATAWSIGNATSGMVVFLVRVPYLSASMSIGAGITVVENFTSFWDSTESEASVWDIGTGGVPYDQSLNTTDDVTFADLNATGKNLFGTQLDIHTEINSQYEWSGEVVRIEAGENIVQGNFVALNATGYLFKAFADDTNTYMPCIGLALKTKNKALMCPVLIQGWVYNSAWSWTGGAEIFVSAGTAGGKTQTPPSGSGDFVQVAAIAFDADLIYVNPDYTKLEII